MVCAFVPSRSAHPPPSHPPPSHPPTLNECPHSFPAVQGNQVVIVYGSNFGPVGSSVLARYSAVSGVRSVIGPAVNTSSELPPPANFTAAACQVPTARPLCVAQCSFRATFVAFEKPTRRRCPTQPLVPCPLHTEHCSPSTHPRHHPIPPCPHSHGVHGWVFLCPAQVVEAHRQINCSTAPGAGSNLVWRLTIDGLTSQSPVTSYAPPSISQLRMVTVRNGDNLVPPVDPVLALSSLSTEGGETVRCREPPACAPGPRRFSACPCVCPCSPRQCVDCWYQVSHYLLSLSPSSTPPPSPVTSALPSGSLGPTLGPSSPTRTWMACG